METGLLLKTIWRLGFRERDLIEKSGISYATFANYKAGKRLSQSTMLRIQFGLEELTKLSEKKTESRSA